MRQRGFGAVEAIIIVVIVLALGGVGYWVFNRQSNENTETPALSEGDNIDTPAVPELKSANDLETVSKSLDTLNIEAGHFDSLEIESQASGF